MTWGRKTGGKVKGSKNKATLEREANAAAEIDRSRREDRELAKDVLDRLMRIAEGTASMHRPPSSAELEKARVEGRSISPGAIS